MDATTTTKQDMSLDEKCHETIDRTFPFFVIHNNHVTILPDTSLLSICSQVYSTALDVFAIPNSAAVLSSETSLKKLLASIFDADHRAFVLEDSDRIVAVLDEDAKACILAQAIAGIVFVLRRLAEHYGHGSTPGSLSNSTAAELTTQALERQLRLFFGSEQRRTLLDRIERNHLWGNCFAKPQILDMIVEAIDVDMAHDSGRSSPALKLADDVVDPVAWVNEQRPTRNLGVPEGLTIMALN